MGAFSTAKPRHMPAVVLAFLPYIGSFLTSKISSSINAVNDALAAAGSDLSVVLGGVTSGNTVGVAFGTLSGNGVPYEGWQRLSQGDIIIAMILSTIVYFIIDRHYTKAAVYCGIGAVLSFFGIIHSGSFGINVSPMVSIAYLLAGAVLLLMVVYRKEDNVPDPETALEEAQERAGQE